MIENLSTEKIKLLILPFNNEIHFLRKPYEEYEYIMYCPVEKNI